MLIDKIIKSLSNGSCDISKIILKTLLVQNPVNKNVPAIIAILPIRKPFLL